MGAVLLTCVFEHRAGMTDPEFVLGEEYHHIPGAVLMPVGSIDEDTAAEVIPEKDSAVLVCCRSGNRSKTASSALAELGYTNIYEFGGINTWPYATEP